MKQFNESELSNIGASPRLIWIDYMKVLGMYFIVYGHFFSIGSKYIYTFNVALFFVISGFLTKKENRPIIFWKKIWYNLILPTIIICSINFLWNCQSEIRHHSFNLNEYYWFPIKLISGFYTSLQVMWFVYTLAVLKIIYQYTNIKTRYLLFFILPICCIINNSLNGTHYEAIQTKEEYANSIINVTLAYPFFIMGNTVSKYKKQINDFNNYYIEIVILLLSLFVIYIAGTYNNYIYMYVNDFGGNFILFLLGGIAGTAFVLILSKLLSVYKSNYIKVLSNGTIIILGFHMIFRRIIKSIIPGQTLYDVMLAAVIMAFFFPIIIIAEKYFPLIIGKYRKF